MKHCYGELTPAFTSDHRQKKIPMFPLKKKCANWVMKWSKISLFRKSETIWNMYQIFVISNLHVRYLYWSVVFFRTLDISIEKVKDFAWTHHMIAIRSSHTYLWTDKLLQKIRDCDSRLRNVQINRYGIEKKRC